MGALLALLRGGGANEEPPIDVNVDLEARPTQDESQLFNYASDVLSPTGYLLDLLRGYQGCGDAIRKAISNPSRETEEAAWNVVSPAVATLKDFYSFSQKIEDLLPRLLVYLCNGNVIQNLEAHQATARRLADLLHFTSTFDELKMSNPNIQNDFSYYRRTLSRMRMANAGSTANLVVHDELANRMSLFYAHSTPMAKCVIDCAQNLVRRNDVNGEGLTDCLAILAAVCYNAASKGRAQGGMVEYCLRVMTVCIIVYDHVSPVGAFAKGTKVNVRASVKAIQTLGGSGGQSLLNSLRYSTVHLNDESTPKNVKQALAT
ncbi:Protein fam49a [Dinochytrium kinnereticum]|nr:Protein fam49a [Dinochytrium kinnereticum]